MYAGKTLAEIARYDDTIMRHIVFRPRDKYGRLVWKDPDLPDWVEVDEEGMRTISRPVPLSVAFKQAGKREGLTKEEAERRWEQYLELNPKCGRLGDEWDVRPGVYQGIVSG